MKTCESSSASSFDDSGDDVLMKSAFDSSEEEKKIIKCDLCNTQFSRVGNLNKHLRLKRCKTQRYDYRYIIESHKEQKLVINYTI